MGNNCAPLVADLFLFCLQRDFLLSLSDNNQADKAFNTTSRYIIIPHVNFPYKTSIDERLIFYNIIRCYSNGECCHVFVIAAGDIIKYQGGRMMRNADARTVRSRKETFNSNGGHDA